MKTKTRPTPLKNVLASIIGLLALCVETEEAETQAAADAFAKERADLDEKIRTNPRLKEHEKRSQAGSTVEQLTETIDWTRQCGARAKVLCEEVRKDLETLVKANKIKSADDLYELSEAWRAKWGQRSREIRADKARVHYCKALALAGDEE